MAALLASALLLHVESALADKPDAAVSRVAGEELDSSLNELPPYRLWSDPTGRTVTPADPVAGTGVARR